MSDDEIEVLDEFPNYGGGGGGERSGGRGAKDQFGRNHRYHFIFSNSIPEDERRDLFTKIKALGGYSTGSIFYTREATHCVAPNHSSRSGLAVLGCLADHRKKLVNPAFIRESFEQGHFLSDTDEKYIPAEFKTISLSRSHGLFRGLRCVIFLNNKIKADRFVDALEDGGAIVAKNLEMRHFNSLSNEQIKNQIDFVFTEPDLFNNKRGDSGRVLQNFYTGAMNRARPVRLLSFYYIFEYVHRPTTSREERAINAYDIKNYHFVNQLH